MNTRDLRSGQWRQSLQIRIFGKEDLLFFGVFNKGLVACLPLVVFTFLPNSALAAFNLEQVRTWALELEPEMTVKLVVNDRVVKQVNRLLRNSSARFSLRQALARMEVDRELLAGLAKKHNIPPEMVAIALLESEYRNLAEVQSLSKKTAGIWQFTRGTAKNFGLQVSLEKDERLDVHLSADAAFRLLKAHHERFKEWNLVALTFNRGEGAIQKCIKASGVALEKIDAWDLAQGQKRDLQYLAKFTALILVIKRPGVLQ